MQRGMGVTVINDKTRGTVIAFNPKRSLGAVKIHGGDYCYMEFLGSEPEPGDVLMGNFESLGGKTVFNETRQINMEVFIEDYHMPRDLALEKIR